MLNNVWNLSLIFGKDLRDTLIDLYDDNSKTNEVVKLGTIVDGYLEAAKLKEENQQLRGLIDNALSYVKGNQVDANNPSAALDASLNLFKGQLITTKFEELNTKLEEAYADLEAARKINNEKGFKCTDLMRENKKLKDELERTDANLKVAFQINADLMRENEELKKDRDACIRCNNEMNDATKRLNATNEELRKTISDMNDEKLRLEAGNSNLKKLLNWDYCMALLNDINDLKNRFNALNKVNLSTLTENDRLLNKLRKVKELLHTYDESVEELIVDEKILAFFKRYINNRDSWLEYADKEGDC